MGIISNYSNKFKEQDNKNLLYICNVLHMQGQGYLPIDTDIFYLPVVSIRRFRTSVWSVNAPTALAVKYNGKGGTVLFSALIKNKNMD